MKLRNLLYYLGLLGLGGCFGADIPAEKLGVDPSGNPIFNLVDNGNFELWDAPFQPSGWELGELSNRNVFGKSTDSYQGELAIRMEANAQGSHFIRQKVELAPNSFYLVTVRASGDIHDWQYGGLSIVGLGSDQVLAKHKFAMKSVPKYSKELSLKFFSGTNEAVWVVLGFEAGINASISFDGLRMQMIEGTDWTRPQPGELIEVLGLGEFDSAQYGQNVELICATINSQLKRPLDQKMVFMEKLKPFMRDSLLTT